MVRCGIWYNAVLILFSIKKEGNSDTCYNMDAPWGHYAKWSQSVTKRQILHDSNSHEVSRSCCLMTIVSVFVRLKNSGDWVYNNANIFNTT